MLTWNRDAVDPHDAPFPPRAGGKTTTKTVTGNDRPCQQSLLIVTSTGRKSTCLFLFYTHTDTHQHTHTHAISEEKMQTKTHNINTICVLICNQHIAFFPLSLLSYITTLHASEIPCRCHLTNCAVWHTSNYSEWGNEGKTNFWRKKQKNISPILIFIWWVYIYCILRFTITQIVFVSSVNRISPFVSFFTSSISFSSTLNSLCWLRFFFFFRFQSFFSSPPAKALFITPH